MVVRSGPRPRFLLITKVVCLERWTRLFFGAARVRPPLRLDLPPLPLDLRRVS